MPIQGTHGEIVIASVRNGKLLFEVPEEMEFMGSIHCPFCESAPLSRYDEGYKDG